MVFFVDESTLKLHESATVWDGNDGDPSRRKPQQVVDHHRDVISSQYYPQSSCLCFVKYTGYIINMINSSCRC